jgi:hypothetical protein
MRDALDGHAMACHWERRERTSGRKKKKWWWQGRRRELVIVKVKRISPK